MRYVTDILETLVDTMDYSICVETVEDLSGDYWKLHVCDCSTTLHARPSSVNRNVYVSNSGTDYKVTDISHDSWIKVYSLTEPPTGTYTLEKPAYKSGTPVEISAEMAIQRGEVDRFPLVWLLETVNVDITGKYDPESNIEMEPDIRIFFLDHADFTQTSAEAYDATVRPMGNLADRFVNQIQDKGIAMYPSRVSHIPYAKFGSNYTNANTADRNSAILSWLPDKSGGIELRIKIPIYKTN